MKPSTVTSTYLININIYFFILKTSLISLGYHSFFYHRHNFFYKMFFFFSNFIRLTASLFSFWKLERYEKVTLYFETIISLPFSTFTLLLLILQQEQQLILLMLLPRLHSHYVLVLWTIKHGCNEILIFMRGENVKKCVAWGRFREDQNTNTGFKNHVKHQH